MTLAYCITLIAVTDYEVKDDCCYSASKQQPVRRVCPSDPSLTHSLHPDNLLGPYRPND